MDEYLEIKQKSISDYPLILTAADIAEILKVSRPTAYAYMDEKDFPLFKEGKNKRCGRDAFFRWFNQRAGGEGVDLDNSTISEEFLMSFLFKMDEVLRKNMLGGR